MDIGELESLETIDPTPLPPWDQTDSIEITIDPDGLQAIEKVAELIKTSEAVLYTDASEKDSTMGAAVVMAS